MDLVIFVMYFSVSREPSFQTSQILDGLLQKFS